MNTLSKACAMAVGAFAAAISFSWAPANAATTSTAAPASSAVVTGVCKDGTSYTGDTKKGACRGHKGVKEWYGSKGASATPAAAAPVAAAPAAAAAAKTAPASVKAAPAKSAVAAGGGAGKVWVNSNSKVYHCQGSKWYGTTKAGEYMTEAQAKAAGNRADHGKACS
jgi:hypothetical protein